MNVARLICSVMAFGAAFSSALASAVPMVGVGGPVYYYVGPNGVPFFASAGVSTDGRSLVLSATGGTSGFRAELWRDQQGPILLEDLESGFRLRFATGLSGDGHTAVGVADPTSPYGQYGGAIWRDTGDVIRTGVLAGPEWLSANSTALAVSDDGSVVVGDSTGVDGYTIATIWTADSGLQALPLDLNARNPGNTRLGSSAAGVSGDGQIVVGTLGAEGFIWSAADGTRVLGGGPSSDEWIQSVVAISNDGSTVIGTGRFAGVDQSYVWTEPTGPVTLGGPVFVPGQLNARATALSADGTVVVGNYRAASGCPALTRTFIWTRDEGFRDLRFALEQIGVDTSEWTCMKDAWGVSVDGTRIYGTGTRTESLADVTYVASLVEASTGVGLCEIGAPDCVPIEIVARSGQSISQDFYEGRYSSFLTPQIDGNGQIAFVAYGSRGTGWGIFGPDGDGNTIPRARQFDLVEGPGGPGDRLASLYLGPHYYPAGDPVLNNSGDLLFMSATVANVEQSVWRNRVGTDYLEHVFLLGDGFPSSPDTPSATTCPSLQIDFRGEASSFVGGGQCFSPTVGSSITDSNGPGLLDPLIKTGDPAPGIEGDVRFSYAHLQWSNLFGNVAFWGYLEGPDVDTSNDTALWATDLTGGLALVMREGDPVPGMPAGTTFSREASNWAEHPSYNDRGELAFLAEMSGPDPGQYPFYGIFKWSPSGSLKLWVQTGDPIPGAPPGATFRFLNEPIMNVSGEIAFNGNYGNWKMTAPGVFVPLLGPGQAAPHLPEGVVLGPVFDGGVSGDHNTGDPALADNGSTVLDFRLSGVGVDETNDRALYYMTASGEPILVLRKGDPIEVAGDEVRIVSGYEIQNAFRSGLGRRPNNARGDIAAKLDFTDGSEAVVVFVVPEPGFGPALAFGVLFVAVLWRRRPKPAIPPSPSACRFGPFA